MKLSTRLYKTKLLKDNSFEYIITTIIKDLDEHHIEIETSKIQDAIKNYKKLLLIADKIKKRGEIKESKIILASSGKTSKDKKKKDVNTLSRTLKFEKPNPHFIGIDKA